MKVVRGYYKLRLVIVFLSVILFLAAIYWMMSGVFYLAIPFLVGALFGLIYIQFPSIQLTANSIILKKTGLVKNFNVSESFLLEDIEELIYIEGDKLSTVIRKTFFYKSNGFGPQISADHLYFKLKDGKEKMILRIGSKKDFQAFAETLEELLKNK